MKNLTPKWLICSLLSLSLIGLNAVPANAWGAPGHRIVAMIAARHLTTQARQRIAELLGQQVRLESVANYADAVRNKYPKTYNFHFTDIPKSHPSYDPSKDCPLDPEKGDCIIAALDRFRQQVVDSQESLPKRRFALKFIIHLIGDLHQPLHCADNNDLGGGALKVKWFGRNTSLHKVWDRLIIEEAELTEEEFTDALDSDLTQADIQAAQQGTVIQWANEAHRAAQEYSYAIPNDRELDQEYYDRNAPIVDQQLLRGGLRLAKVLNTLFN